MKKYILGNILRGWFTGEFSSIEEAWSILSRRFMHSYPTESEGGRSVVMYVYEINPYGFEQNIGCKKGECETGALTEEEFERCDRYKGLTNC